MWPGVSRAVESERADRDGLTVGQAMVGSPELGSGADDVDRVGLRGELASAGHVIVVEMRLEDVADPQLPPAGRREIDIDVAAGVDDGRNAGRFIGDEGADVAQTLDDELLHEHGGRVTPPTGRRAGTAASPWACDAPAVWRC